MRGKAHAVIGLAAAAPIAAASPDTGLIALATGVLGGLVPDADHPDSVIGRCIPWPAVREDWRTGRWRPGGVVWHRGEVHSVGCALLASLPVGVIAALVTKTVLITAAASAGFLLGYLSHLVADLLSPSPQMLLWPVTRRYWRPAWLPAAKVESLAGMVLERAASVVALGFTFVALHSMLPDLVDTLARLPALLASSSGGS